MCREHPSFISKLRILQPVSHAVVGCYKCVLCVQVATARKLDKLAIAVDHRPVVRGGIMLYFVLLHFLVCLSELRDLVLPIC